MPRAAPVAVQIAKQLVNAAEGEESAAAIEALAGALAATTDGRARGRRGVPREAPAKFRGARSDSRWSMPHCS